MSSNTLQLPQASLLDEEKSRTAKIWLEMLVALLAILISLTPAMSTEVARVPGRLLMAAAIYKTQADFPALALRNHSPFEVDVIVGPDGTVKEAQVISANILLWDSLRAAALKWKFDPAKLSVDHDVVGTVTIDFKFAD